MEPKVLADALCEAGIGRRWNETGSRYALGRNGPDMTTEQFITDWRVAGKVLEDKTFNIRAVCERRKMGKVYSVRWLRDPAAIIEAWYEATAQGESDDL